MSEGSKVEVGSAKQVTLTLCMPERHWGEILYAVESKLNDVRAGRYAGGAKQGAEVIRTWSEDLEQIKKFLEMQFQRPKVKY